MTRPLAWLLATGLGSGLFPWFPGTFGSLVALVIYWFVLPDPDGGIASLIIYSLVTVAVFVSGCRAAGWLERTHGRDHRSIVIDEFAGQWVALIALPKILPIAAAGFVLFRLFDIIKPFPLRRLESLPGGLGVMIDDLAAGIYTNLLLRVLILAGVPFITG